MAQRGLKASLKGIEKAKTALLRCNFNQKSLSIELGLARSTVTNFFSQKPIDRKNFEEICFRLNLDWEEIVEMPSVLNENITSFPKNVTLNPNFIGREEAIADLKTFAIQGSKIIGIYGTGGIGKTTLALRFFEIQGFSQVLILRIPTETTDITPVEQWVKRWLSQEFKEQPETDFNLMLEQLRDNLQNTKIGILIDNIEPALDAEGKFIQDHRHYVDLLKVLADSFLNSLTLLTSRERLNESQANIRHYFLLGLDLEAWQTFFTTRNINTDSPNFQKIHDFFGGNAKAMEIICGSIQADYQNNIDAYFYDFNHYELINFELKDLVESQLKRLKNIDFNAYKVLCRLGFYSNWEYFNITKPALLALLCEVPHHLQIQAIASLKNRCLIETKLNEINQLEYFLHPVIQSVCKSQLTFDEDFNNDLLILMKQQIDHLIADEPDYQEFLLWIHQKSCAVETPYKIATVRSFYFILIGHPAIDLNLAPAIDFTFARDLNEIPSPICSGDFTLASNLIKAGAIDLAIDFNLMINIYYAIFPEDIYENTYLFMTNLYEILETTQNYSKNWCDHLNLLIKELPNPDDDEELLTWWDNQNKIGKWVNDLAALIIEDRQIELYWQLDFTPEDWRILLEYYDANRLLIECMNKCYYITDFVKKEIEETLLLPLEEIEKWKQQHRPTNP